MKKSLLPFRLVIWCIAVFSLLGCAGVRTIDTDSTEKYSAADLVENPKEWKDVSDKIRAGKAVVIMVPEGMTMPLKAEMVTPIATLIPGENQIRFNRDAYVHISDRMMLVSPDGERWASIGDWDVLKKLFGIEGGTFNLGFGATEEEGSFMNMKVTTR